MVRDEDVRYPKIWSLDKASSTEDVFGDEPDSVKLNVQLSYCPQESVDIPGVKKSNKKCQVVESKSFQVVGRVLSECVNGTEIEVKNTMRSSGLGPTDQVFV